MGFTPVITQPAQRQTVASPTSRTCDYLRRRGYRVAIVEKWNAHTKTRHDLFGWMDVLAFKGSMIYGIQATTFSNRSSRIKKVLANDHALAWVQAEHRGAVVFGWKKRGRHWSGHQVHLTATDFKESDNVQNRQHSIGFQL